MLKKLEKIEKRKLYFIIGGNMPSLDSVCWQDSTSFDSKKYDSGGCSKKLDTTEFSTY